eukprot:3232004-Rhodomonas_salina.4
MERRVSQLSCAMSGTDLAYGAVSAYARDMRCPGKFREERGVVLSEEEEEFVSPLAKVGSYALAMRCPVLPKRLALLSYAVL